MATTVKISALTPATSISGGEKLEIVQSGASKSATASQIYSPLVSDLANSSDPAKGAALVGFKGRSVYSKLLDDVINARDYGLSDTTGATSQTAALQQAIDFAALMGKPLWVNAGKYLIDGAVDTRKVSLIGPGVFRRNVAASDYDDDGATFLITSTTVSPFVITESGGVHFEGINFFWPNQSVSTTPVAYPALITVGTGDQLVDVTMRDCAVINAYDFIHLPVGATSMGDVRIESCRIFALRRAFWFAEAAPEVIFVSGCTFSPGIYQNVAVFAHSGYLMNWHANNGCFIYIDIASGGTVDGMRISNTLVFGPRRAIHIVSGGLFDFETSNTSFDGVSQPLKVEGAGKMLSCQFNGGMHYIYMADASGTSETGYAINTTGIVQLTFDGVNIPNASGSLLSVEGTGEKSIVVNGGRIANWGVSSGVDSYALYVDAADAIVHFAPSIAKGYTSGLNIPVYAKTLTSLLIDGLHDDCKLSLQTDAALVAGRIKFNAIVSNTVSSATLALAGAVGTVEVGPQAILDKPNGLVAWPNSRRRSGSITFGAGPTVATFANSAVDDGISYSAGTFTIPSSGVYEWNCLLSEDGTNATGDIFSVSAKKAGSAAEAWTNYVYLPNKITLIQNIGVGYFAAGDTFAVEVARFSGSGNLTTIADGAANYITLRKVA